jgi:hypothetical protein
MRFVLLCAVLCLVAVPCAAQRSTDPNIGLLRRAGGPADYPRASTLVVYDSTDVDVQETGLSYVLMHRLTKVLTAAGAKDLRNINFNYDPLSAAVEVRLVRIYRNDGSVEVLPADRVIDYPAPARAIYWGAREKMVNVGRLEAGDAVETMVFRKGFTYALLADPEDDSKFIPPMRGHFYDIVEFWTGVPIKEKVYRVAMPDDKPLQYEVYNGELSSYVHFSVRNTHRIIVESNPAAKSIPADPNSLHPTAGMLRAPGKTIYCWYKRDMEPFKGEPGMTSPSDAAPKLLLSTSPDWYAKSVWFNKVNEDFKSFEVTSDVQKLTDSLLAGVTDELQKISILNHWAAEEIRYSGISMGTGEGFTLHPGSMTLLDRCGVCKDKAGMVITLLRAAGFESYPAMTMAGSRVDRIPADQFNHSVALVKRANGNWMLLDPTWIPGVREMWSSAEQQQEFLAGIPGGADIMSTPISLADNHYLKFDATSELSADGVLKGTITATAEGQSDASIRRAFSRSFASSWHEFLPRLLYSVAPQAEIAEQKYSDPNDLSAPITLKIQYRIPDYAAKAGNKMLFVPILAKNPFSDAATSTELSMDTTVGDRRYLWRTRCSKSVEITEQVKLPAGYTATEVPTFHDVHDDASAFSASYAVQNNTLSLLALHRMEKRVYDPGDWPVFKKGLKERLLLSETAIVLTKKEGTK